MIISTWNATLEVYSLHPCDNCDLKSWIKQPTCYKNCFHLLLANAPPSFQSTCVLEAGLSDFEMTLTVMRKSFKKLQPRIINYRPYKNFSNKKFKSCLLSELRKEDFVNNDKGFERLCIIRMKALNKHDAPRKKRFARGNQMRFVTKYLSKEITKRSRLRNIFLKNMSVENRMLYTQQRNCCVSLLRKIKIGYYANFNEKKILDNKQFWKVVKPLFSDKSISGDEINLTENGERVKIEMKTAEVLNSFF